MPRGRSEALSDAEKVSVISALEEAKSALAAAQAHLTVALERVQLAEQQAAGVRKSKRGAATPSRCQESAERGELDRLQPHPTSRQHLTRHGWPKRP